MWYLFELTIVAFAAGWAIPSGFVAGIPVAAWFLRRRGVPFSQGMASFGISRFLELTAYAGILPAALLSAVGSRTTVRIGAVTMLAAMLLVYLDLFLDWRLARRLLRRVGRVSPWLRRAVEAAVAFCADVAYFFRGPVGYVVLAAAFSFAAIGMALARALLASAFLDLHLSAPEVVVMFAITVLLMAVPFLPGAIGAFEGGIAAAFEMIGRSKADGLAYALSVHAAENLFPRVAEAYLVKRDGLVIWAGNAQAHMSPASLTKMMSALVILESGRLDETVTVSRESSLRGQSPRSERNWRAAAATTGFAFRVASPNACRAASRAPARSPRSRRTRASARRASINARGADCRADRRCARRTSP